MPIRPSGLGQREVNEERESLRLGEYIRELLPVGAGEARRAQRAERQNGHRSRGGVSGEPILFSTEIMTRGPLVESGPMSLPTPIKQIMRDAGVLQILRLR